MTPQYHVAVLVMTSGPAGSEPDDPLGTLLGSERAATLRRELLRRAVNWAGDVAPGGVHVEPGAGSALELAELSARLFPAGGGVLLIAWADLPHWRADHATGALEDLADGCDVSVGPVFEGGFYLLALARPLPELFAVPDGDWLGPNAMGSAFAAAHQAGLTVGMLRAERGLRGPEDVRALVADPMLDPEMRKLLS